MSEFVEKIRFEMFTQEEKELAKYFKFSMDPLNELTRFLNSRFLPILSNERLQQQSGSHTTTIPKQIVLFWHDIHPPLDVEDSIKKIHLNNPQYLVFLFNEESAGQFIRDHYGDEYFYLFSHRCVHPTMQSDFFRICYLAQEGGIYMDVDVNCYASVDTIYNYDTFECFFLYSLGNPSCIDNDFIACQPKNPVILAILEQLKENLTEKRSFANIWECTGPGVISMVVLNFLMKTILLDDVPNNPLNSLKLADHSLSARSYSHAELEYKKSKAGNWRYFKLPKALYLL